MSNQSKSDFASFCLENGIDPQKTPEAVEKRLKRLMGKNRYEKYLDTTDHVHAGLLPIKHTYDCMNSLEEANCLISHQAEIFVNVSFAVYLKIKDRLIPGLQVGDLGCYTGIFVKWLASKYEDSRFLGFDLSKKHINFSKQSNSLPNLNFTVWDYSKTGSYLAQPCDILLSVFGIDFDPASSDNWSLDSSNLRDCPAYIEKCKEAYGYFNSWKEAIKPEGILVAVLRIPSVNHLISCVDAASKAGWKFDLNSSMRVTSDEESFPLMVFHVSGSEENSFSQESLLDWWEYNYPSSSKSVDEIQYIKKWNMMKDKTVIKESTKTYPDGHTMICLIGKSGEIAFSYSRATTGFTRLKIVPADQLESLQFIRA